LGPRAHAMVLERIASSGLPAIAAVNKIDRAYPRERLLPFIADLAKQFEFREIVPVSALKLEQVEVLREAIARHLPVAPALFAPGTLTDRDLPFRIAEIIRERLTLGGSSSWMPRSGWIGRDRSRSCLVRAASGCSASGAQRGCS
jgi:GTPase Era involved in 16S rRNA processing